MERNEIIPAGYAEPVKELNFQMAGQTNSRRITVSPRTTAGEIMNREVPAGRQMHLTVRPGSTPFGKDDMLYDRVSDGDTLYAVPNPTFGMK